MMISPVTYYGYDANNNKIVKITSADATDYLNPIEVQRAIEDFERVVNEQLSKIARDLVNLEQDAHEAIIVRGTGMDRAIDDTAGSVRDIAQEIVDSVSDFYDKSVNAKDRLQEANNNSALAEAKAYPGVTYVS